VALPKYAFFQGRIVPYIDAKVSVLTHALNYGTAAFAGMRAYWNAEQKQLYIFRPHDHFKRLLNSAKILCMETDYTPESLTQILLDLLHTERYECDIYIRPLFYKADEGIGVRLHGLRDEFSMVAFPYDQYMANDTNAHVTISSWRRVDDNVIPARGKIAGAYANSSLIKTDAVRAGFDEALVLNQDGHISEGSAMNFFMVRDGLLVTPPITENILEGIIRKSVIEFSRNELGLAVIERPVDRTEVFLCEEVFLTGTAAQITAVTRVDHRKVGKGQMGPITSRLRDIFQDVVRGRHSAYKEWAIPVY
jgi:branched-chain amino acid aminotransferase